MPKLRTLVLNFGIFGNDVKCSRDETPERSSGVLNFGTSRYAGLFGQLKKLNHVLTPHRYGRSISKETRWNDGADVAPSTGMAIGIRLGILHEDAPHAWFFRGVFGCVHVHPLWAASRALVIRGDFPAGFQIAICARDCVGLVNKRIILCNLHANAGARNCLTHLCIV